MLRWQSRDYMAWVPTCLAIHSSHKWVGEASQEGLLILGLRAVGHFSAKTYRSGYPGRSGVLDLKTRGPKFNPQYCMFLSDAVVSSPPNKRRAGVGLGYHYLCYHYGKGIFLSQMSCRLISGTPGHRVVSVAAGCPQGPGFADGELRLMQGHEWQSGDLRPCPLYTMCLLGHDSDRGLEDSVCEKRQTLSCSLGVSGGADCGSTVWCREGLT